MKVKDVMSAETIKYCTPETKLKTATSLMKEENRGALPVVDKNNKVVGIVTDRDICLSLASKNGKPHAEMNVREILPKFKLRTVKPEDEVSTALLQMRKNKIGRLPVTDAQGHLKGMISVNTLLSRALARKQELGKLSAKDENLAKTIKALYDRNNQKKK